MTRANQKRLNSIGERLISLAAENPPSSACLYAILDAIMLLTQVGTDFHFRPEVNDEAL